MVLENIRNSSYRTSILFHSSNPILNNIQNSNGAKLTLYGKKCWTWKTPRVVNNGEIHLKSSRSKKIPQSSMEANTLITFGNPNSKQYTRFFGSGEIKSKNITLLFSHRDFNILTHRFTAENIVLINRMMTPSIINRGVLESKNNIELHSVNKVRNSGTISIGKTLYQTGNQEITKSLTFLNRGNFRGMFKNHGALTLDNYGAMNAIINQKYLSKFKNHSGAQGEISIR